MNSFTMTFFLSTLFSLVAFCSGNNIFVSSVSNEVHLNFILSGVNSVLVSGQPGTISVLDDRAFPILSGKANQILRPHVGGTEFGGGRIVVFSHTSFYLPKNSPTQHDNIKLYLNSIKWAGKNQVQRVGLYPWDLQEQISILSADGILGQEVSAANLNDATFLAQFDAILINNLGNNVDKEVLRNYVRNGGGLVIAATPWSFSGGVNNMESFWANLLLRDTGLFYIGAHYVYGNMDGPSFNASVELLKDTNAYTVWTDLKTLLANQRHLTVATTRQLMLILEDRFVYGPIDEYLSGDLANAITRVPTVIPTGSDHVTLEYQKSFLIIHRYLSDFLNAVRWSNFIPAHPSSTSFPGVPELTKNEKMSHIVEINQVIPNWANGMDFEQIKKFMPNSTIIFDRPDGQKSQELFETVEIDTTRTFWHSTGLYALPGKSIEITVLNADDTMSELGVQIGAHQDNIQHLSNWQRYPQLVFRGRIVNNTAKISSPCGGPVYITFYGYRNITLQISITGAVSSPSFFMGKTNVNKWRSEIRYNPGSWGELVGKNLIIIARRSLLAQLDDPEEVIRMWDLIMDGIADLATIPRERVRAERFVSDIQISAGYMHSGYPIMYFLDQHSRAINMTEMRREAWKMWGFFHEIGHNHQKSDWTFGGTGEVTCNLFALYIMHSVLGVSNGEGHEMLEEATVERLIRDYTNKGKQFSDWKSDAWLALNTYIQLQDTFGWSSYQRVFANYHKLSEEERPKNDQEKIDLWMIMFSRVAQENLTPFFRSWGIPITTEAEQLANDLPPTALRIPSYTSTET